MAVTRLIYETWVSEYKPIDNEFNPDVPGGQLFLAPYSVEEQEFLKGIESSRIWSYGSGEYGGTYIWSSLDSLGSDLIGCYVTEVGYTNTDITEIEFFEPEYTCPRCEEFWSGDDVALQRQKYEDSCEKCGTDEDLR